MDTTDGIETKVYVTNMAGHDFTPALQYGELIAITKGNVSFQSLDRLKYNIAGRIMNSRKEDYLILSGAAVIVALTVALWMHLHGEIRMLVYDTDTQKYRLTTVDAVIGQSVFSLQGEDYDDGEA